MLHPPFFPSSIQQIHRSSTATPQFVRFDPALALRPSPSPTVFFISFFRISSHQQTTSRPPSIIKYDHHSQSQQIYHNDFD
jgi:hypothetical protein